MSKVKYALPSSSPWRLGTVATLFAFLSVTQMLLCLEEPHLYVYITLACVCIPRCYEMTYPSVFIWMQEVATERKPREGCNIIESFKRVYFRACSSCWLLKLLIELQEGLGTVATLFAFLSQRLLCREKPKCLYICYTCMFLQVTHTKMLWNDISFKVFECEKLQLNANLGLVTRNIKEGCNILKMLYNRILQTYSLL